MIKNQLPLTTSDFTYHLPKHLIATHPPKTRGDAKLLVIHRLNQSQDRLANSQDLLKLAGQLKHRNYQDMADYFHPGDLLILNDTKVFKARLIAQTTQGEDRELLVLEKHGQETNPHQAKVLYRGLISNNQRLTVLDPGIKKPEQSSSRKIPESIDNVRSTIHIVKKFDDGTAIIESSIPITDLLDTQGNVPLPPYIKRPATTADVARYQTTFAHHLGSAAAPTASLNFTNQLKQKLINKGVIIKYLTLHVGLGTFLPIRTNNLTDHKMHQEYFQIPADTVHAIQTARINHNKITALGTTVTRALEFSAKKILTTYDLRPMTLTGEADIFIYPGYQFQIIDHLITNFHAPRSTVLMLTAAFTGWPLLHHAYQQAIDHNYRFLSYGDTCFII